MILLSLFNVTQETADDVKKGLYLSSNTRCDSAQVCLNFYVLHAGRWPRAVVYLIWNVQIKLVGCCILAKDAVSC